MQRERLRLAVSVRRWVGACVSEGGGGPQRCLAYHTLTVLQQPHSSLRYATVVYMLVEKPLLAKQLALNNFLAFTPTPPRASKRVGYKTHPGLSSRFIARTNERFFSFSVRRDDIYVQY